MTAHNSKTGRLLKNITEIIAVEYVALSLLAKCCQPYSIYKDSLDQRNPFEGKRVEFIPDQKDPQNADGERGHLSPTGESAGTESCYEAIVKNSLDKMLSFAGLTLLAPVFVGLSLAIVIDDPGPVFFTQKRVGKNKQYFKLHKFRSMKMATPHDVPTHMLENPEEYITKVGKFIRAHSLDELPQIWDIFLGNMSVIGPRPALWNQDVLTAERDKYSANEIKPGLTGWAQINGRDELELQEKARLDGVYTEHLKKGGLNAFLFDFRCFMGTVFSAAKGEGVVEGGTGKMKKRIITERECKNGGQNTCVDRPDREIRRCPCGAYCQKH